jgi:hypothetical protein
MKKGAVANFTHLRQPQFFAILLELKSENSKIKTQLHL